MKTSLMPDLFSVLDTVVMERKDSGSFHLLGAAPEWFQGMVPDPSPKIERMRFAGLFPFLETFLVEAETFWSKRKKGRLKSGTWREADSEGKEYNLEASAVCFKGSKILLIERIGERFQEKQTLLQKGRELRLDYQRLEQAEAKLKEMYGRIEKSHGDMLAVLNQLDLGIVLIDGKGRVTFLNRNAERVFGRATTDAKGKKWSRTLQLREKDRARIQNLFEQAPEERKKASISVEGPRKKHYRMKVDVQDDPRFPERKILFFYDVSDVYDLRRMLDKKARFHDLVGKSIPMNQIYEQIQEIAKVESTVLIEGETGTGKELVARAIHFSGPRMGKPFIAVNSAGLSESLLASQLFGHKRGAFTGAVADQKGVFEAAQGGTLFLDEIGDVPQSTQTSLLRVLQEKELTRLGESGPRKVDVRVLTATQRDLNHEMDKGVFRSDLLYRIRVARIQLPALRNRREDIPLLAETFLRQNRSATGKPVEDISDDAMRMLMAYDWPGNVRELKSAVEFALIRCKGSSLLPKDLPAEVLQSTPSRTPLPAGDPKDEKQRLMDALARSNGNRTAAARLLGISRATLYRRMSELGIEPSKVPPAGTG